MKRQFAFFNFRGRVFWSSYEPAKHEPFSAVVNLVQGIYEEFPEQSFFMLRQRIFANYSLSLLDREMVRVAAKRISEFPNLAVESIQELVQMSRPETFVSAFWEIKKKPEMEAVSHGQKLQTRKEINLALENLEKKSIQVSEKYLSDRALACLLLDSEQICVAGSWNSSRSNRTLHAEVRTLQKYWQVAQKPLPKHSVLVCSLKPCRMCAAMIWHMAEDPFSIKIVYSKDDPGPLAQRTVLSPHLIEISADCAQSQGLFL